MRRTYDDTAIPVRIFPFFRIISAILIYVYRIPHAVHDRFEERDPRDPAMKPTEACKRPARQPDEGIIPRGEQPDNRDVG